MEDIEYLEGYEDIVLPEINSCGDSFADKTVADTDATVKAIAAEKENYDDNDTSSSIDPDVFNYFFDIHSDDDTLPENKVVHILNQKEDSMDSTDHLVKDLGEHISDELHLKSTASETPPVSQTMSTVNSTPTSKTISKVVPSTSEPERPTIKNKRVGAPKESSCSPSIKNNSSAVQNQQKQLKRIPKSSYESSRCLDSATSVNRKTAGSDILITTKISVESRKRQNKPAATIVRPEKIINNDPIEDPLNLDNLSDVASDLYTISDISGETLYHTLSELDDDDDDDILGTNNTGPTGTENFSSGSQINELSHDSDSTPSNLDVKTIKSSSNTSALKDMPSTSASGVKLKPLEQPQILYKAKKRNENLSDSRKSDCDGEADNQTDDMNISTDLLAARTAKVIESLPTKAIIISDTILMPYTPNPGFKNNTDKTKPIQVSITPIPDPGIKPPTNLISPSNNSNDSNLSTVDEMLEESYAEAMLKMKAQQEIEHLEDVGAELEVSCVDATAVKKVEEKLKLELKNVEERVLINKEDKRPIGTVNTLETKSVELMAGTIAKSKSNEEATEAKKKNISLDENSEVQKNKERKVESNTEKVAASSSNSTAIKSKTVAKEMAKSENNQQENKTISNVAKSNAIPKMETIGESHFKEKSCQKDNETQSNNAKSAPAAMSHTTSTLSTVGKEFDKGETKKGNEMASIIPEAPASSVSDTPTKLEIKLTNSQRSDEKGSNMAKITTTGTPQRFTAQKATTKEDAKMESDKKTYETETKANASIRSKTSVKLKPATKIKIELASSKKGGVMDSNIDMTVTKSISETSATNVFAKKEVIKVESGQREKEAALPIAKSKIATECQASEARKPPTKQVDNKIDKDQKGNELKSGTTKPIFTSKPQTPSKVKPSAKEVIKSGSVRNEDNNKSHSTKTTIAIASQMSTKSKTATKEVAKIRPGQKDSEMQSKLSGVTFVNDKQITMKSIFIPKVMAEIGSSQKTQTKAATTCLASLSANPKTAIKKSEYDQEGNEVKLNIADATVGSGSQISVKPKPASKQVDKSESNQKQKEMETRGAKTAIANKSQKLTSSSPTKAKTVKVETGGKESEAEKDIKDANASTSNNVENSKLAPKERTSRGNATKVNIADKKLCIKEVGKVEISEETTNTAATNEKEVKLKVTSIINRDKKLKRSEQVDEQQRQKDNDGESDRSLSIEESKSKDGAIIKDPVSEKQNITTKSEKKNVIPEGETTERLRTSILLSNEKVETSPIENFKSISIESDEKKIFKNQNSSVTCVECPTKEEKNISTENENIEAELNDLQAIIEQSKLDISETEKSPKARSRKKRFRNLRTPEVPTSEDELKDTLNDFKGFEGFDEDLDGNQSSLKNKIERQKNDERSEYKKEQMGVKLDMPKETHMEPQGMSREKDIEKCQPSERETTDKFKNKAQKGSPVRPTDPPAVVHSEKISHDKNVDAKFENIYDSKSVRHSKEANKVLPVESKIKSDKKDFGRSSSSIARDSKSSAFSDSRRTPTRRDKQSTNDSKGIVTNSPEHKPSALQENKPNVKMDKSEIPNLKKKNDEKLIRDINLEDEKNSSVGVTDFKKSKNVAENETNLNLINPANVKETKADIRTTTDVSRKDDTRNSKDVKHSKDSRSSTEGSKDRKEIKLSTGACSPPSTPSKQKPNFKDNERKDPMDSSSSRESSKDRKEIKLIKQMSSPVSTSSKQKPDFTESCSLRESFKERKDGKPTKEASSFGDSFNSQEPLKERRYSKSTKDMSSGTSTPSRLKSIFKSKETASAKDSCSSRESSKEHKNGKDTIEIFSPTNTHVKNKDTRSSKDSCSSRESSKERKDSKIVKEMFSPTNITTKQRTNLRDNETRSSKDSCDVRDLPNDRKDIKLMSETSIPASTQQKYNFKNKEIKSPKDFRSSRELAKEIKDGKAANDTCMLARTSSKEKLDNASVTDLRGSKSNLISKDLTESKDSTAKSNKDVCKTKSLSRESSLDSKCSEKQKTSRSSRDSSRDSRDDKVLLNSPKEITAHFRGSLKEIFSPPKIKSVTTKSTTTSEPRSLTRVEKETLQAVKSNANENKTNEKSKGKSISKEEDSCSGKSDSKAIEKRVPKSSNIEESNTKEREISSGKRTFTASTDNEEKIEKRKITKPNTIEKLSEKTKETDVSKQKTAPNFKFEEKTAEKLVEKPEETVKDSAIVHNTKIKEKIKEKTIKSNTVEKSVHDGKEKAILHNPNDTSEEANDKKPNFSTTLQKSPPDNATAMRKLSSDKLTIVSRSSPNNCQAVRKSLSKDNNSDVLDEASPKAPRILRDRSKGDQKARQEELPKASPVNDKSATLAMEASKVSKTKDTCSETNNPLPASEEQNKSSDDLSKYLNTHKYLSSPTNSTSSQNSDTRRAATPSVSEIYLRRTLRKRGAESPFVEKDDAKRLFKEPQVQKKGAKTSKQEEVPIIFSSPVVSLVQNKRNLRSPNIETGKDDLSIAAKKPKLDLTRKSLRSRKVVVEELGELETKVSAQNTLKKVKVEVKSLPFRQENKDQAAERQLNKPLTDTRIGSIESSPKESVKEKEKKFLNKLFSINPEEKNTEIHIEKVETDVNDSETNNSQSTSYRKSLRSEDALKQQNNSKREETIPNLSNKCIMEKGSTSPSPSKKTNFSDKSPSTSVMTFTEWLQTQKKTTATENEKQKVTVYPLVSEISCSPSQGVQVLSAKISTDKINKAGIVRKTKRGYQKFWRRRKISQKSSAIIAADAELDKSTVNSVERSSNSTPKFRIKRSETETLMDSWSKKMKESLLNADSPLEKRQRSILHKSTLPAPTLGKLNKLPVFKETTVIEEKPKPIAESTKQQQKVQKTLTSSNKLLPPSESTSAIENTVFPKPQVFVSLDGKDKKLNTYEFTRRKEKSVNLPVTSKSDIEFKIPQKKLGVVVKDKCKLPIRRLVVRINRSIVRRYLQTSNQTESPKIGNVFKEPNLLTKEMKAHKTIKSGIWTNSHGRIALSSCLPKTKSSPSSRIVSKTQSISNVSHVPLVTNNPQTGLRIGAVISRGNLMTITPRQASATQVIAQSGANSAITCNTTNSTGSQQTDNNASGLLPPTISSVLHTPETTPTEVLSKTVEKTSCTQVKSSPLANEDDAFVAVQPKHEIDDDALPALPDTQTLMARAHSITAAAVSAMNSSFTGINGQQPANIRLLNTSETESYQNSFVPSFGVTPPLLDAKGTRLYSFLHPVKYNRNHGSVLLDYCCPYLDGNMPAIDPTRMHTQIHTPIREIPAYIVLTTKVITRAELESNCSTVPDVVRQKAEKLRNSALIGSNQQTGFTNTTTLSATTSTLTANAILSPAVNTPASTSSTLSANAILSPTINALARHLPRTTTITPKIRAAITSQESNLLHGSSSVTCTVPSVAQQQKEQQQDSDPHHSMNLSNFKRLDALIKKFVKPFDQLTIADRHRVIESLLTTCKFQSKDLENTIILIEEYFKQILHLNSVSSSISTVPSNTIVQTNATDLVLTNASSPLQDVSDSSLATTTGTKQKSLNYEIPRKSIQFHDGVPIYDTEKNIIGYQLQTVPPPVASMPAYTKSTMSTRAGNIMSTGNVPSSTFPNTSTGRSPHSNRTGSLTQKRPSKSLKRPSQESLPMFYATPPRRASTPITKAAKMIATATIGKTPTTTTITGGVRKFPSSSNTGITLTSSILPMPSSETVNIIAKATVSRITRKSTATSKITVLSKTRNSDESEFISLGDNHRTLVKHEENVEDLADL
ncbi:su(var)2-HP2 isoform 3-T3 [Glossina fuscipes fuscipes]